MATITGYMFLNCPYNLQKELINDLSSGDTTIKVALLSDSATITQTTDDSYNDLKSKEISGTGYTAGGKEIANKTLTKDTNNKRVTFDGDDVEWTGATFTTRYAIIYDATPASDSDKKLICYLDFGENKSVSNEAFKITWNASGIFRFNIS